MFEIISDLSFSHKALTYEKDHIRNVPQDESVHDSFLTFQFRMDTHVTIFILLRNGIALSCML